MSAKRELIKGTMILTAAGLIARVLGLYNRIYLANLISNAELGRYQLIFPVFALCMAVSGAGIQVALSKMVAEFHASGRKREMWLSVILAMAWSLGLALICSGILWMFADRIAVDLLQESACGPYLRILAAAIPFAALHTCVSGYFFGCKQTAVPAVTQLLEQIARVGCIYGLSVLWYGAHPADASIAVYGLLAGESVSCIVTLICFGADMSGRQLLAVRPGRKMIGGKLLAVLWQYAGWLTVNRVSVTLLQSAEMILIPMMLARYCGDSVTALEIFGVMTGIVMPILSFPTTLTNALSTMLLPTISEAEAVHNYKGIADTFEKSIGSCMMMGILMCMIFAIYGGDIGIVLFHDAEAGQNIRIFSIICPLMYLQSLFASTLNGFGKMNETLMHHVIASGIRIAGILLLIPKIGMMGYLVGMMAANGVVSIIASVRLHQLAGVRFHGARDILLPACVGVVSGALSRLVSPPVFLQLLPGSEMLWQLFWQCGCMTVLFAAGMFLWLLYMKSRR